MEDYLIREIDKIGEMIQRIASKLGLGGPSGPTESIRQQFKAEMLTVLELPLDKLLLMDNPIDYLVCEKKFSLSNLELLAITMYQALPASDALHRFLHETADYLEQQGYLSFSLHSLLF